ncbi:FAD-binding protein [Streptomyces sp. NPDC055722]
MPIFVPKSHLLRPATEGSARDRVPDTRASGTPEELRRDLVGLLGEDKVLHKVSDLVKYATDASPYRFIPQAVVIAETVEDISRLFAYALSHGRKIVFRAAGTSLNGQSQGEDILVDVRRHWTGVEVLEDGARARIAPGTTVARANITLARHGRKMGPDPASASVATVGGVVANNACGMSAGTTRNSYRLLSSVTLVLPSGTTVDTGAPDAEAKLWQAEPQLCQDLLALKQQIEADEQLVTRIRAKYELKNTNGYRLDALLDGATPVEILRGLVVGSEGTLGFIAQTVFDTVPMDRFASTAMLFFPSLPEAAAAVPLFNAAGARAVELMDGNTLRASAHVQGVPEDWADIPATTTALLVEFRAPDEETRAAYEEAATRVDSVVIHPTCSMHHLDDVEHLQAIAAVCADEADTPVYAECCGFAGDRGMLHKELTESAAKHEAEEVTSRHYDAHLSANRMCEIGMEHVTGRPYYSALIALERATRPSPRA